MRLEEVEVETVGNLRLYVRDFSPSPGRLAGRSEWSGDAPLTGCSSRTLVWIHGLGEHGGRYLHLPEFLNERGWRIILIDLRGHGRSTGVRTHVRSFDG